jgi:hypothetical protein
MVNLLETLYVITAGAFVAALVCTLRGRRGPARALGVGAVLLAGVCAALYHHLSPG